MQDSVPVVVAFTKFDVVMSMVIYSQDYETARAKVYARCKDSLRSVFGRVPVDFSAEIVQGSSALLSVELL